jgi:sulfate adenylyltransferase subunit 2
MTDSERYSLTNLQALEAESIHIIREVAAEFENPVMLYSIGKDSSVMAHLAIKAFYPEKVPFPLLHVDTGYKFPEMYRFRDEFAEKNRLKLIVYRNNEAFRCGINPIDLGSVKCCAELKTRALLDAIDKGGYDAAFGGARRDEEKSRAKERIYSFRDNYGQWDPKNQRPELWNLYNGRINKGESIRVFPLSNWTELDIWTYIYHENIQVVPLYFAQKRKVIQRNGQIIPIYPDTRIQGEEKIYEIMCRFRTLGCHFCTGAVRSAAVTLPEIIEEMMVVRNSERITRVIDHDQDSSMEQKKREGYF